MGELRPDTILLIWLLLFPFFAALGAGLFPRLRLQPHSAREAQAMPRGPLIIAALSSFLGLGLSLSLLPQVTGGLPITADYWWTRDLYHLRWQADALSLMATALVHGVGLVASLLLVGLPTLTPPHRRAGFLLLAQGAAAAACLSADVVVVVFCLQGAAVCLWLSLAVEGTGDASPMLASVVLGLTFVLAGVLLMWEQTGDASTAPMQLLLVSLDPSQVRSIAAVVLLGALPLCIAWPASGWAISLAGAGAGRALAPALLLPPLGAYLTLRLLPGTLVLNLASGLGSLVVLLGLLGLWWGAARAAVVHSLRQFAAWLTVAQAGVFLLTLGAVAHPQAPATAVQAAALQAVVSALALTVIWLATETVGARWGTDSIPDLNAVFARAPFPSLALIISGLSLTAAPFLPGYLSQRLLVSSLLQEHRPAIVVLLVLADLLVAFAVLDTLRRILPASSSPSKPPWSSGWFSLSLLVALAALLWAVLFPSSLTGWAEKTSARVLTISRTSFPLTP